jgi:hypothetical protein
MAEFKFFCPQCGQQILCDTGYSGTQINCPACKQVVVVPQAPGSAAQPPVPAKSHLWRNVLVIAAAVIVLAGLVTAGWFAYSKFQRGHMPPGLVGMWLGENGGNDSAGGNKAVLTDISFADGKVGQAFNFNSANSSIQIAASSSLNVGAGVGFTIMAWVNPSDVSRPNPIVEWNNGGAYGVHFYVTTTYPGNLYANIVDNSGAGHLIYTTHAVVMANVFQHVALTYDKASGVATLYCNGAAVLQQTVGSFTPQTACNLYLGKRPLTRGETYTFAGLLDQTAIYNRALSGEEIKAIAVEENHGEPLTSPTPNMQ